MAHDNGVDFRDIHPDEQFNCAIGGRDHFLAQMKTFSHHENVWTDCHFLRGSRDPSHMHLELLEYEGNGSKGHRMICVEGEESLTRSSMCRTTERSWPEADVVPKRCVLVSPVMKNAD